METKFWNRNGRMLTSTRERPCHSHCARVSRFGSQLSCAQLQSVRNIKDEKMKMKTKSSGGLAMQLSCARCDWLINQSNFRIYFCFYFLYFLF